MSYELIKKQYHSVVKRNVSAINYRLLCLLRFTSYNHFWVALFLYFINSSVQLHVTFCIKHLVVLILRDL